ncbi:hypothetical protein PPL_05941 [Heterostelium album PN500]|uniref:F-box domain-containing protein n=1 Tax=Heterostelium pallidum (strain ATCC 26659 / Pp 5 / PN500) TaxID=670386 RepID=D3BBS2_HETP5|nr:hypothetical protein PPL_05941 [Heterostelium album PN500]EFA81105.1 hypothetical protein PPL_05941 [Heterostelium album PN500]|eukprot:XP_020433223.1 hypothetical protein PPL_05941 [Heterostelium album PN500]
MTNKENNNGHHVFVNLPFILLNRIIVELDENIDIICFSLVCKRWFDHIDKYLCFDTKQLTKLHNLSLQDINNKCFRLNSYRNAFSKSIDRISSDCTVFIYNHNDHPDLVKFKELKEFPFTDYIITIDEFKSSILDASISKVIFDSDIKLDHDIIDVLSRSNNVHTIQNLLRNGMPESDNDNEQFQLPSNIKKIKLVPLMVPSIYPKQLESLDIYLEQPLFRLSVLPRSLKSFRVIGYKTKTIDFSDLPPNLETFLFTIRDVNALNQTFMLPSTLKAAQIPIRWLKNIKCSHSIHTLYLQSDTDNDQIETGDIPESVTSLTFSGILKINRNILPSGLRYLRLLNHVGLDNDTLLSLEHLETLDLSFIRADVTQLIYPNSLKHLYLPLKNKSCLMLPPSLELLSAYSLDNSLIPKSVTHFDFDYISLIGQVLKLS